MNKAQDTVREISVSDSEWVIMELLWDGAPLTLMQTVAAANEKTGWAKSTVTTMLKRMEKKGLITCEEGERARRYCPAIPREDAVLKETRSLIDKAYNGSVRMLFSALTEKTGLSEKDMRELNDILDKIDGQT